MRVVYYTMPSFFDLSLPFIAEMSRRVELHVLLELHPNAWQSSMFDAPPRSLPAKIGPAGSLMDAFPGVARQCFKDVASFSLVPYAGRRSLSPASLRESREAVKFIRRLGPDVVHLEGTSGRLAWWQWGLNRLPLVLTVHDPETHSGEAPIRKRILRRLWFRGAKRFILHNHAQRASFCAMHGIAPERVHVVPLGIYELYRAYQPEGPVGGGQSVLFFGRISAYKGLEVLYQAAQMACRQVQDLHFIVAGRVQAGYRLPPAPALQNGGTLQVLDRYISNREAAQLMQQASVVVCPYLDATQSGVVLTAYAFGKPVVASRVGGLPEYIRDGETGLLVPPDSPGDLAAALVSIVTELRASSDVARRYSQNIERLGRTDLAWDRIARATEEVYARAYEYAPVANSAQEVIP